MRFFLLAFLSVFSVASFGATYEWNWGTGSPKYPSATAACQGYMDNLPANNRLKNATLKSISTPNPTTYICHVEYPADNGTMLTTTFGVYRTGQECPPDTEYNAATGACDPPPEPCKVGDLFPSKGTTGPVVTTNGRNFVISSPRTMCSKKCLYSDPAARPSGCYGVPGAEGWCNYIIKGTGEACGSDDYEISQSGPQLNPPDTPNVPDSPPNLQCPPGWAASNGTCYKKPPEFCDPSTGRVCAPGTTDPNATPPPPGAGGTPGTPGEGSGGGGGGGGGAGGRPDSSSGSDADLQDLLGGIGQPEACKPRADGSGCEGSTVRGEACDKVIECTGDAVQCAILRQEKKIACAMVYEDARPFIEQQIAKDAYQLQERTVDGSGLFTDALSAPRWMPSSCPSPKNINLSHLSTSLSFQPACDFASALGPLFIALASIFFAVYVGRAFGGN